MTDLQEWAPFTGTREEALARRYWEMGSDPFALPALAKEHGFDVARVCEQWRVLECHLSEEYEDLL